MNDPSDLSGVWYGDYASNHWSVDPNSFIALLEEQGGSLSGSITERDIWLGSGIVRASVDGTRQGLTVRFRKQYDGSGGLSHAVDYQGTVNDDATRIVGRWKMRFYAGSFSMSREKFAGEEVAEEIEEAVPVV
ncbi:hypothetical protein [Sphingomonas sp. 37zxx]|uniref:hypothetical protein n=1 Tax=Sphingomonas sp. 37zxx TaxID=1550073 RepID=UPI00068D9C3A|nr:hypothetical protein [Sphingomonas sp. 37zxx]